MSTPTRRFVLTALIALSTLGLPGAAKADVAEDPPSATITSPQDGDMFSGAPITLDAVADAARAAGAAATLSNPRKRAYCKGVVASYRREVARDVRELRIFA